MRILALSDIHGNFAVVNKILERELAYDVILLCGDLTTKGTPQEVENALQHVRSYGIPYFAVAGNMDSPDIEAALVAADCSINGTGKKVGDVGFFGVSASPLSSLHTPYEIPEVEIVQIAARGWNEIKDTRRKVFVPHAPPRNTTLDKTFLGSHVGSTSIRAFIERYEPDVVVCGHIHEARGTDTLGHTRMINCGQAAKGYYGIIEIGEDIRVENHG